MARARRRRTRWPLAGLLIVSAAALAPGASAETYLTPFAGVAFGGDSRDTPLSYGGSLTFRGEDGVLGFAVDFGHQPKFFGDDPLVRESHVTTLMGNLVFKTPGRNGLYVSGGLGLLKANARDVSGFFEVDSNELGVNVGGGFTFFPGEGRIGLQADLRYFRSLTDPEPDDEFDVDFGDLDYTRATAGVAFRF